jgi:hypothetical protein
LAIQTSDFQANSLLSSRLAYGHNLALMPQTLAELIHSVTDYRRMTEAIRSAWLMRHHLGRKRLLKHQSTSICV